MADTVTTVTDPQLTDRTPQLKGVLQKDPKMFLYLGAVVLLLLATVISSRKKTPTASQRESPGLKVQIWTPILSDRLGCVTQLVCGGGIPFLSRNFFEYRLKNGIHGGRTQASTISASKRNGSFS